MSADALRHAARLLLAAADKVRTVDIDGDRFDLLAEAERLAAAADESEPIPVPEVRDSDFGEFEDAQR